MLEKTRHNVIGTSTIDNDVHNIGYPREETVILYHIQMSWYMSEQRNTLRALIYFVSPVLRVLPCQSFLSDTRHTDVDRVPSEALPLVSFRSLPESPAL